MRDRAGNTLQGLAFATLAVMSLQLEAGQPQPSNPDCLPMTATPNPETSADAFDGEGDDCPNDDVVGDDGLDPELCAALLEVKRQGRAIDDALAEDMKRCEEWPHWHGVAGGAVGYPVGQANWSPTIWTSVLGSPKSTVVRTGRAGAGTAVAMGQLVKRFGGVLGRVAQRFPILKGPAAAQRMVGGAKGGLSRAASAARKRSTLANKRTGMSVRGQGRRFNEMLTRCAGNRASCKALKNSLVRANVWSGYFKKYYKKPGAVKESVITRTNGKLEYWIAKECLKKPKCKGAALKAAMRKVETVRAMNASSAFPTFFKIPAYDPYFGSGFTLTIGNPDNKSEVPIPGTDVELTIFIDRLWK